MRVRNSKAVLTLTLSCLLASSIWVNIAQAKHLKVQQDVIDTKSELINEYQTMIELYELENETLKENLIVRLNELTIEEMFKVAANVYDLDFNLVYAIARLETGNFTSGLWLNSNNPGGIKSGSEWASYRSRFVGIMEMCRMLRYGYIDQGLTTPEAIGKKYCPNSSEGWAEKVNQLMQ